MLSVLKLVLTNPDNCSFCVFGSLDELLKTIKEDSRIKGCEVLAGPKGSSLTFGTGVLMSSNFLRLQTD